jgi:hypothetical protein
MSKYNFIPVDTIINRFYRDFKPLDPVEPRDIIEWVGEGLFKLGAKRLLTEEIAFLKVENHRATLPAGLCEIIQVSYSPVDNTPQNCSTDTCECPKEDSDCNYCNEITEDQIYFDCWQKDINYILPEKRYLEVIHSYEIYKSLTPYFFNHYVPMRLMTNTLGIALKYQCSNSPNLYSTSQYEYKIDNNIIYTNVQEGSIVVVYTKQPLDDRGYPLILDLEEVQEALTKYVALKTMLPRLYMNEQNIGNLYMKLEDDWNWYCRQAKNKMMIPDTLDEKQNHADIGRRLIKPFNSYFGHFGNLNIQEQFSLDGRKKTTY